MASHIVWIVIKIFNYFYLVISLLTVFGECRTIAEELFTLYRWQTTRGGPLEMWDNSTQRYYKSLASFTVEQFCRQRNLVPYKVRIVRNCLRRLLMRNPLP